MHLLGPELHCLTTLTCASGQRGAAAPAAHSTSWLRFHPLSSPFQRLLKLLRLLLLLQALLLLWYIVIHCLLSPTAHMCFQYRRPLPRSLLRPHQMPLRLRRSNNQVLSSCQYVFPCHPHSCSDVPQASASSSSEGPAHCQHGSGQSSPGE